MAMQVPSHIINDGTNSIKCYIQIRIQLNQQNLFQTQIDCGAYNTKRSKDNLE